MVMHEGDDAGEFLTAFGGYVLTPKIFELLSDSIKHNLRSASSGNFCLTTVLDRLRVEEGLLGCEVKGQRFNISTVASYIETIAEFNK